MLAVGYLVGIVVGIVLGIGYGIGLAAIFTGLAIGLPALLVPIFGFIAVFFGNFGLAVWVVVVVAHALLFTLCYLLVVADYRIAPVNNPLEASMGIINPGRIASGAVEALGRGCMVGATTAANVIVLLMITPLIPFAVAALVVLLLAAISAIRRLSAFQVVLGYMSLVLPMSWPITLLGLLFFVINLIASAAVPIVGYRADWTSGTLYMRGGLLSFNQYAYNMGNIGFIHSTLTDDPDSPEPPGPATNNGTTLTRNIFHESGHTLILPLFGYPFHLIGAIHQNAFPTTLLGGHFAYSELLAESLRRAADRSWMPFFGMLRNVPPTAVPAAAEITVPVNTSVTLDPTPSEDPDATPGLGLTFLWTRRPDTPAVAGVPERIVQALSVGTPAPTPVASFTPQAPGTHLFDLFVHDGIDRTQAPVPVRVVVTP